VSGTVLADYPKTVVLKDGAHLVLRAMVAEDRAAVARLIAGAPPEERPLAAEVVVLACDGEHVAGAAALARRGDDAAAVTVVLDPAYRGRRLGTWMLLDAIHLAADLGLVRLEASACAGDDERLAALRRLDFVVDTERSSDSRRVLAKTLHRAWTDF
jgi:GNAT superfamily N-acetyltransferase